jgi:signal transduction histidine kinase/ActR/RegA family two-component response regulator
MAKSIHQLEQEISRLSREFFILSTISQAVNQSVDLHEILNNGLDRIKELTEISSAAVFLLEGMDNVLILAAQRGFSKRFAKGLRKLKLGEGIAGKAALAGEAMFIEDYPTHPQAIPVTAEEGIKAFVAIPLKAKTKIYGALTVAWKDGHRFNAFERNFFDSVGQIISGAMERAFLYTENVKRLEEQKTLYSISQEIASRLELKVILQKIMEKTVDLLGVDAGEITLWDPRKQGYVSAIVHGLSKSLAGREIHPLGGIVGEICTKKGPVLYDDYEHHSDRWRKLDPYHFKQVLGVPLNVRQMIIGTMVVGSSDTQKRFQPNDIELLSNLGSQAAIAIGNARLYEDSLAKIKQLTSLHEIGKALSSTLDIDELLQKALELLRDSLGHSRCGILLLDQEKKELYMKQVIGRSLDEVKDIRFRVGVDGIVGWVAQTGEPLYVPDVSKDPRYIPGLPEGRSKASFPLKVRDQVIGVLDVESTEVGGFDEEDLKVLSSFASQVSISIENARLFAELKQTLRELRQAQDQIVQAEKLRALGEMASGVAHDFNNSLAVILGNIQLLLYQLEDLRTEEIREQLKILERSTKDGAETVRRIQEFTGVRKDREFIGVSLGEIIKEVVTITQPRWKDQAQAEGVQIELTMQVEEVPFVFGNPSELKEVLTNVVFNAVEAMPEGGRITVSARPHGSWVEVRIADTGVGMREEVRKRVFDPFFTTKGVTNSGLGMSVSYGIVRRHGGEILIETEPGKGTTFIIHLPSVHPEEEMKEEERPVRAVPPARILVIDDEAAVRDILSRMLKTQGHQVVAASDGEEGIERFGGEAFDLVLTDLGMPKVSGWEVGKALKKMNPKVPVAIITGWGMELNREKMRESGIDLIISKPFNVDQVIQVVSEALELKEKM